MSRKPPHAARRARFGLTRILLVAPQTPREPMMKIARCLREHRELILNYIRAQTLISSGVV